MVKSDSEIFTYWEDVKLMLVDRSFPKFQFFPESLNLSFTTNSYRLSSLK